MMRLTIFVLMALGAVACGGTADNTDLRKKADDACAANPACVAARAQAAEDAKRVAADAPARAERERAAKEVQQAANQKQQAAATASLEKALGEFRRRGFVTRMDGGARSIAGASRIYVSGELWSGFKVDQKEDLVTFFSRYRKATENLPQVTLYDDTTGRELASYGAFSGVSLK